MKNFKEINREEVITELKKKNTVVAVVINCENKIVTGGEYIKSGVYPLNSRMSIDDITRYEKEDNVAFFAHCNEEE